jgi:hypothetical protein
MWAFQPVEPVGAEQDKVNQQRQNKQEDEQGNKNTPWVEKQPKSPHVRFLLDELRDRVGSHATSIIQPRRGVSVGAW